MTALRAALGAVSGGLEGARIQEAAEAEKKRMADALARQTRMDTAAQEDRAEAKADRLRSQRQSLLAGGYIPTGLDMPGATPRQAVNTETVGGQDFALYSTPIQLAMKAAKEAAELKAKFNPETMTPYQQGQAERDERRVRVLEANSQKDASDKTSKAGIDKVIAGAGKIVASDRAQEARLQSRLQSLENRRPDPTSSRSLLKTEDELKAEEAAWQSKVDAVEKELETVQERLSRTSPVYESSTFSRDTTGYGAAFGSRAAKGTPAKPPTYNTKEAALSAGAQRKISEIQSSDLTPEEKQVLIQQTNDILKTEILKLRGSGR